VRTLSPYQQDPGITSGPTSVGESNSTAALLVDAYGDSAEGDAVVTDSMLAAVRPSFSARATGRPEPLAMRGVRSLARSRSIAVASAALAFVLRATLTAADASS
jgi:hypothetical protein